MKINAFFANRLRTPLVNPRWSWGAYNASENRVFLRVGRWAVNDYSDGKKWAIVYDPEFRRSTGHKERLRHLDAIANGADGFIVLVDFNSQNKIKALDDETLYRVGSITKEHGLTYAEVVSEHSVDEIIEVRHGQSGVVADVEDLFRSELPETTRRAMVDARIGQGGFRTGVLRLWDYKCAVTGVTCSDVIRASHIKPWSKCDDRERLDPHNGLPLVATLDALFDKGLIAFDKRRQLHVSPQVRDEDRRRLSLRNQGLSRRPPKDTVKYLEIHWEYFIQRSSE